MGKQTVCHQDGYAGCGAPVSCEYLRRVGERLRRQGLAASAACVFLKTNRHLEDLPEYHPQAGRELLVPSSFTRNWSAGDIMCLGPSVRLPSKWPH